jgi:hypothetical protein
MICKQCGTAHDGSVNLPGHGWIEFLLWFAYLVPGAIYSIWRRSKRQPTCRACGSREMVAVHTPVGAKLVREHYPDGMPTCRPASVQPLAGTAKAVHLATKFLLGGLVLALAVTAVVAAVATRF